jgi:hypothetical protein
VVAAHKLTITKEERKYCLKIHTRINKLSYISCILSFEQKGKREEKYIKKKKHYHIYKGIRSVLYYLASILCMHACMLWLLPVSTLQCGFPHLGRMKTTKYFTCRTQFPCMSDHMNNLPKDTTGYISPILNRDSFRKPERKKGKKEKKKQKLFLCPVSNCIFFSLCPA